MILNKNIVHLLSCCFVLLSCEKTVVFEVETKENKLVVNSIIGPDTTATASVSLSIDPLAIGDEITYVDDATIQFYKNNVYLGNFIYADGLYSFNENLFDAHETDIFKIEVSVPGRETVSAETVIPAEIEIEDVTITDTTYETISYSVIDSSGNIVYYDSLVPYYQLQVTFTDPEGLDYYSLEVVYEDLFSSTYTCFSTTDPVFTVDNQYTFGETDDENVTLCEEVFFTDITFENKKKNLTFSLLQLPTEYTIDPKFIIKLKHLSEDYHQFVSSSDLQNGNFDDPFAEPVIVYSNIENGFGIFAGYNLSVKIIEL